MSHLHRHLYRRFPHHAGWGPHDHCATLYGPVAHVCHSMIPITTVTPIDHMGMCPPYHHPHYHHPHYHHHHHKHPYHHMMHDHFGATPYSFAGEFHAGAVHGAEAMTGAIPGIYTSDVAMPGIW